MHIYLHYFHIYACICTSIYVYIKHMSICLYDICMFVCIYIHFIIGTYVYILYIYIDILYIYIYIYIYIFILLVVVF